MSRKRISTAWGLGLLAALLLVVGDAGAAVTYVRTVSTGIVTNRTSGSVTFDATGVELAVASVQTTGSGEGAGTVSAITFAGQAMTALPNGSIESHNPSQNVRVQTFYYINSAIGGYTGNQTVSVTLGTVAFLDFSVAGFAGIDKTAPIQDSQSSSGWGSDVTVTLNTTANGSRVFSNGAMNDSHDISLVMTPTVTMTNAWEHNDSDDMRAEGWYSAAIADATNSQAIRLSGVSAPNRSVLVAASLTPDATRPSVALSSSAPAVVGGPIAVTATLSEDSSDFAAGDITPSNALVSDFVRTAGSWTVYTFTLTPTAPGDFSAVVNQNVFTDYAGNNNTASNTLTRNFDETPPSVLSIVRAGANPTNAASVDFTVTFSENVTGVDTTDFDLNITGGVAGATITGVGADTGSTRTVSVDTGSGSGTLGLDLVDNDSIVDVASLPLGGEGENNGDYTGESYTIHKDAPTGCSVLINGDDPYTNDPDVTLDLTATDVLDIAMRFSYDNETWSEWEPFAATKSWSLLGGEGVNNVYAEFMDALGNTIAEPVADGIVLDTIPPTGSFVINGGDDSTTNVNVTLDITADPDMTAVPFMQVSENGSDWDAPVLFDATFPYTLPAGDGSKMVYVRLLDGAGNPSEAMSDSIILDTTGPEGTVTINGGALYTTSADVTLTLDALDAFDGVPFMSISNNGTDWTRVAFSTPYDWTLAGPDGENTVYVKFEDDLGNETDPPVTDTIILDTSIPTGTMSINDGDEFTNSLGLSVLVTTSDPDVADVQYSSDDGVTWTDWHTYEAAADSVNVSAGDGVKTVLARLRDTAGNVSEEEISDDITLDQTPPVGSVLIAGDAVAVNYSPVELTVSATDDTSGVDLMQFGSYGDDWSTPEPYATSKSWILDVAAEGTKTVYVKFIDNAGNESSGVDSDSVEYDTTAPSPPNVTGTTPNNNVRPTWFWTSVDGVGPGTQWTYQLDGGAWSEPSSATDFTPDTDLTPDGVYTLCVKESDAAGNWSEAECKAITIDTAGPNAPVVTGPVSSNNLQPTWSWLSGGGGGIEQYRIQLDGTADDGWSEVGGALSFTPGAPLDDVQTHTLYVEELDEAGNWSEYGSWEIFVNSGLVTDPTVSGVTPTNDTTPLWTWVSGGGLDEYRYQLDGEDEAGWTETIATSWEPTEPLPGEGAYTLYVQQRLTPSIWSGSGSFAITIDLTSPMAPIVSSNGTPRDGGLPDITNSEQPLWTWTPGGGGNGTFRYQIDGTDVGGWTETDSTAFAPAAPIDPGVHTMYVQERDEAGNWSDPGERAVEIDIAGPTPPVVVGPGTTSDTTPMWTWTPGGGGNGTFRYQLDDTADGGWTVTTDLSFVPGVALPNGTHTLYVQERDEASNWSDSGTGTANVQPDAPNAPDVTSPAITNDTQPTWTWVSGGGSGNFRYQMNGEAGDWTATTETSFTPPEPLEEAFYTLYVQESNEADVWSASGSSTTQVDLTAPNAPVVTGPSTTPDATPTWTWTAGGGGNGTFRYQLDGEDGEWTETAETQFTPGVNLGAGPHVLYVGERDEAGNWSLSGSWTVTVQLAGPQPPVVSGPEVTNNLRPQWSWVGGGGGNGRFRYQLNSEDGTWQLTTAISFRPMAPFTEDGEYTLFVQEQDALGNWSQSGQWTIVIDTVPPAPPILTGATPVRTKQPTWTWTSGGGGGAGLFRVQLDSEDDVWKLTNDLFYTPPLPLDKDAHTLYVQESDAAGNWSASSLYTIVIDAKAVLSPIVSGDTPTNDTTPTWTWEAATDSGGNGQFSYRLDGGDWVVSGGMSFTPAAPLAQGDHVLDVRESDEFDEWSWPGSFTITIDLGLPVITIVGDNPAQVSAGTAYTDEGATAVDSSNNDITDEIVVTGLPIDTNVLGSYSVTYSLTGYSVEAVRTVNVVSGVTEVNIASPVAGSTLYMPATGAPVLLALTSVAPEGTETVTYTFDAVEVGSATEAPWLVVVELTPAAGLFGEHTIGAADATKASSDEVMLTIAEIPAGADTDANGIPDNPFATLESGDLWAQDGVIVLRTDGVMPVAAGAPNVVALANPANTAQRLLAAVSPSVLGADEMAAIILKAADGLVELLGATEAALVADPPAGYLVAGNLYGALNVAVSPDGTNYDNLGGDILENYPVVLTVEDSLSATVEVFLHGAEVMDGAAGVVIGIPDAAVWDDTEIVHLDVAGGTATATLSALGLVAAFEPLPAEGEGEGEGEGEDHGGCFAANLQPPTTPRSGDGLVLLLAVALLLPVLRLRPRANPIR